MKLTRKEVGDVGEGHVRRILEKARLPFWSAATREEEHNSLDFHISERWWIEVKTIDVRESKMHSINNHCWHKLQTWPQPSIVVLCWMREGYEVCRADWLHSQNLRLRDTYPPTTRCEMTGLDWIPGKIGRDHTLWRFVEPKQSEPFNGDAARQLDAIFGAENDDTNRRYQPR